MNTKITLSTLTEALDMDYGSEDNNTEDVGVTIGIDLFIILAIEAHERDVTINFLANEIINNKLKELGVFDPPIIPGVGSAPYMEDWKY